MINNSWIYQLITESPFTAFFLSLPTAAVLVLWAWSISTVVEQTYHFIINLFVAMANTTVVLCRGYPPSAPAPDSADLPSDETP